MTTEKQMNSRVLLKNDIEANWMKAVNFIPKQGEAIIYNAELDGQEPVANGQALRLPIRYPRIKFGDGTTNVNDLPFADEFIAEEIAKCYANDVVVLAEAQKQISEVMPVKWYIQDDEPLDAPEGSLWLDTDAVGAISPVLTDEEINQIVNKEMEAIVNDSY